MTEVPTFSSELATESEPRKIISELAVESDYLTYKFDLSEINYLDNESGFRLRYQLTRSRGLWKQNLSWNYCNTVIPHQFLNIEIPSRNTPELNNAIISFIEEADAKQGVNFRTGPLQRIITY